MADGTSVRDSLTATLAELSDPTPAPAPEPVAAAAEAPAAHEPNTDTEAKAAPAPEGRDDKGRFAPKETKAPEPVAEAKTETAQPAAVEPQETEAIRIPPSLPAAVKAQFKDLAPEVRDAFVKLEDSVQTAKAEWGKKGERLNRYDEIMAPRTEKLTLQGIDEFTAIKTLFAAQDFLERDAVGGLKYLAQSYGVTPQQVAQAFGLTQASGQQTAPEGQAAPTAQPDHMAALQPFLQRVQTLEQRFQSESQSQEAAKLASAQAMVADFASKPENMYFDNVRDDVARRLQSDAAKTLAEAYEQAIWASPEIRPLLLKAQAVDAANKATSAAAATKAKTAQQASGSVTGGPAAGATAPPGLPGSVRDSLLAARQELGSV